MTYTPPPNDAIELEFTEYTPDPGDAVTISIQEALNSKIALSNDAVDFTFDTTDAYQAPVNDAVNFQLVDIVSVVGATVEEPLTIPAPTGSGPGNVPLTTSGQPPLPSGVTNDGQFAWGDTARQGTDSATVVLQWTRPQPAIDPPPGIDVAEVVAATYTPPDGTPITVTERLINPARDPNTGTQQDTPVAIDQNPPAGDVTYQVKLFYYDETAGQHGAQVVSRSVDTTEAVQFNWPDTISDPTTRVTTVDLRREGPLTVPDTATIVSDVVTGRYDGTTYTLGSGGLAGRGILHDVNAPAGMITYARTITYDTQSGTRETVSKTRMKDTRAPPAPLSVTAQRTGTTIDQSLPYDYLLTRVSPQSVPVTATPTIATAEDANAIPDSGVARWEFEEGSGTTAVDSWNDNDGTINGATYTSNAKLGTFALDFDGTNDSIDVPHSTSIEPGTSEFSAAAWVRADSTGRLLSKRSGAASHWEIAIESGDIRLKLDDGSNKTRILTGQGIIDSTYHHVCAVRTSSDAFVYIDGSVSDSTSDGTNDVSNSNNLEIGERNGNRYLNAIVDDVRIYNKGLSSTEVSGLYNTGSING